MAEGKGQAMGQRFGWMGVEGTGTRQHRFRPRGRARKHSQQQDTRSTRHALPDPIEHEKRIVLCRQSGPTRTLVVQSRLKVIRSVPAHPRGATSLHQPPGGCDRVTAQGRAWGHSQVGPRAGTDPGVSRALPVGSGWPWADIRGRRWALRRGPARVWMALSMHGWLWRKQPAGQ